MADKDLIRFYFDTMALHEQLMQWYRAFFIALGGVFLSAVFAFYNVGVTGWMWWIPVVLGLFGNICWIWVTTQRELMVNRQMRRIIELTKEDTNLKHSFKLYDPKLKRLRFAAPIIFNFALPLIVGFFLIFTLWKFGNICGVCSGLTALIFTVLAVFAWLERRFKAVPNNE